MDESNHLPKRRNKKSLSFYTKKRVVTNLDPVIKCYDNYIQCS